MKKKFLYFTLFLFLILVIYSFFRDYKLKDTSFKDRIVYISQKKIQVNFVPKNSIYPAFGLAFSNEVKIREDLSPSVKRFVLAHELYHTGDNIKWGGWLGREFRANIVPAMSDPVGFITTVFASLNPTRLLFYLDRFKRGN
jgi:hypothetical protein